MKELDLYDGAAPAAADDWASLVWRRFPAAIRERYEPGAVLGEGGMGIVLAAHDRRMDRPVAVKGVRDPATLTAAGRARLAREARLHARLVHPNVMPIYDSWTDADGNPWCAMLRVEGAGGPPTLAARLDALAAVALERRPVAELLEVLTQICRAVAHAHDRGIVHRDLKPENVLLGPSGEALVADWGLAVDLAAPGDAAPDSAGSPRYSAPEQLRGAATDARSDVYGLGAILHEMVCGGDFRPGAAIPDRVPRELASIIRRATAPDRAQRFAGPRELQQAVRAYQAGGFVEGLEYSLAERAAKWVRARPRASAALATALAFSAALAWGQARHQRQLAEEVARTTARLNEAQRNLAVSHAGWAAVEEGRGEADEAQAYAALAFRCAAQVTPAMRLPEGPVWPIFVARTPPSPLIWACRMGKSCRAIAFPPGGHRLEVAADDRWYRFDLARTQRPAVWRMPATRTWNDVFDPECRRVVTSERTSEFAVRRFGEERSVTLHTAKPTSSRPAFSPDGRLLATASGDDVCLWDPDAGSLLATLRGHASDVWILAFDPTGRWLATTDRRGGVRLWDVPGRREVARHQLGAPALSVAFAPAGDALVLAGADSAMRLVSVPALAPLGAFGEALPAQLSVAFSPDGTQLASGGNDFAVRLWEVKSRRLTATLTGHRLWVGCVQWTPDGRVLATAAADGTVRLWDVPRALAAGRPQGLEHARDLAFSPDGTRLASLSLAGAFRLQETSTARVLATTVPGAVADAVGFAPEPLVARADGRTVRVLDPLGGGPARTFDAGAAVALLPAAPVPALALHVLALRGGRLAAARDDGSIRVWPLAGGPPVDLAPGKAPPARLALSPRGDRLAAGDTGGGLRVFALPEGRVVATAQAAAHAISALAWAASGDALAWGEDDGRVGVLAGPGWKLAEVGHHLAPVFGVALNANGDTLASAAGEATYLWKVATREKVPDLQVHGDYVTALAFGPGDALLALALAGPPAVWDLTAADHPLARVDEITRQSFFTYDETDFQLVPKEVGQAPEPRWPANP